MDQYFDSLACVPGLSSKTSAKALPQAVSAHNLYRSHSKLLKLELEGSINVISVQYPPFGNCPP